MVAISRTDLARNTREILDQVRHGQTIVVQSYGQEQIVMLDALDYRLMQAVVAYAVAMNSPSEIDVSIGATMRAYLNDTISLAKAAEQFGLTRYELMERFERLGIPLRIGPASIEEAREEVRTAEQAISSEP